MLSSYLRIAGRSFDARGAARRLGLKREHYALKGQVVGLGRWCRKSAVSVVRIPLSENDHMGKHMAEVERQIDGILPFLAEQRSRYGTRIEMSIETGTTVGSQKAFVRSVDLGPQLMAKLAAFGIRVSFTAYPCSED